MAFLGFVDGLQHGSIALESLEVAVQGIFFMASTAVSRSPNGSPPRLFIGGSQRRSCADSEISRVRQKVSTCDGIGQNSSQLSQVLRVCDPLLIDLLNDCIKPRLAPRASCSLP